MINSRRKGHDGERETARIWSRALNSEIKRMYQAEETVKYGDIDGEALRKLNLHVECKTVGKKIFHHVLKGFEQCENKEPEKVAVIRLKITNRKIKKNKRLIILKENDFLKIISVIHNYLSKT